MLKILLPGAAVAILASAAALSPTAAVAAPTSSLLTLKSAVPGDTLQIRDDHHHRHRYRPGGRYRRAPSHWHRYHRRPYDWYARGCIVVGPVWFCP